VRHNEPENTVVVIERHCFTGKHNYVMVTLTSLALAGMSVYAMRSVAGWCLQSAALVLRVRRNTSNVCRRKHMLLL
jgi:hypothetical protein